MKKEIKIALSVFILFVAFLWLEKPFREILISYHVNELKAKYISGVIVRIIILLISILIIKRLHLRNFNGIQKKIQARNLQATLIPLVIITVGIISNWGTYVSIDLSLLILFGISVIIIGFIEEFIFRGIILPLIIKLFRREKKVLLISVTLSAVMFGAIHFINFFSQPDNFTGILSQVFFALSIGVFFGGLILRTGNILIPSIIHGLINFSFGTGDLKEATPLMPGGQAGDINWSSIIITTLFFSVILIAGIYMINKTKTETVLIKLS